MYKKNDEAPLAERVRPQELNGLLGQEKIWGEDKPLFNLVSKDRFNSLIFWGPPGTGKTTLAFLIGRQLSRPVHVLSAVNAGVKDIRGVIEVSMDRQRLGDKAVLLFMDEIHRLNKNQQDVLLPVLETGVVKFIGATTENPSFEVNSAVNSRSMIFRFEPIHEAALCDIQRRALNSLKTDGLAEYSIPEVSDAVLKVIASSCGGDARRALNLLEAVVLSVSDGVKEIGQEDLKEFADTLMLRYDKAGDDHYDTISAFIKSVRGSHPDAALHYLARMLDAGEDPLFIARRLVILASEDIGNANPTGLLLAMGGFEAVHAIGMPEARIILSQVTTYLAASPKSNRAYLAIDEALTDVKKFGALEIPMQLRNAPTQLMKKFGYSRGYAYAHDDREASLEMAYLPEKLRFRKYYEPSEIGAESQLKQNLAKLRPRRD